MPGKVHWKRLEVWKREFEAAIPRIMQVARFRLRGIRGNARDEAEADMLGFAWMNYRAIRERGGDPEPLLGKIAEFACLAATSSCRDPTNDLLSRKARDRHGFSLHSLDEAEDGELSPEAADALEDHHAVDPAETVPALLDLGAFISEQPERNRVVAAALAEGKTETEAGELIGLGRGTASNIRRAMKREWEGRDR